jgi:hypothetical protein
MKTEDLINALAEDHAARPQPGSLRRTFFVAMALGLTLAAIAFALTCVSAWNKDPVSGVIGVQTRPH